MTPGGTGLEAAVGSPSGDTSWCLHRRHPRVELGPRDAERLWRWVTWEETPLFPEPGRTAWMPLSEPVAHPTVDGLVLSAAKVKGIGVSSGEDEPPTPVDGEREYLAARDQPHFGLDPDGNYIEVFSRSAPLGGMVLARAVQEYENADRLLRASVPAVVPLAVFRDEQCFRGEPLAVAVTLSTEPAPFRSNSLIAARDAIRSREERDYRVDSERTLGLDASLSSPDGLTAGFTTIATAVGSAIRAMAEAGLYRHSSGMWNFQYCRARQRLLLIDLDSSRQLAEVDYERRGLEILRDVASAVHKVVEGIFMHPQFLRDAGLVRLTEADPVLALLRSYFPDVPARQVGRAAALTWAYVIPIAIAQDRRRREAGANWTRDKREMHRVDKWTLYALAMMVCQPLLEASRLSEVGLASRGQVSLRCALPLVGDGAVFLRWAETQIDSTSGRRGASVK